MTIGSSGVASIFMSMPANRLTFGITPLAAPSGRYSSKCWRETNALLGVLALASPVACSPSTAPAGPNHLGGATAIGATSATLSVALPAFAKGTRLAFDPYTSNCEVREIKTTSGDQVTFDATTAAHAAGTSVALIEGSEVTPQLFGAVGDGKTPDDDAINRALATGLTVHLSAPSKCYQTTRALRFVTPGQIVYGDGRTRSKLCVSSLSKDLERARGVIDFGSGEPGPQLRDFGVEFDQPKGSKPCNAPSYRAPEAKSCAPLELKDVTRYPPAIFAQATPRFRVSHFRISRAWDGIDMTLNSGGALIEDLEISAFHYGIWIDGSADTVRINDLHSWPFDLYDFQKIPDLDPPPGLYGGGQKQAFFHPSVETLHVGGCDGLKVHGGMSIAGTAMNFVPPANTKQGPAFGFVSDFGFDTHNGVRMSAGNIMMSNVYFTLEDSSSPQAIVMRGGHLALSNFWMLAGPSSVPMVSLDNRDTVENTSLIMSNGRISMGKQTPMFIKTSGHNFPHAGNGRIGLANNSFDTDIPGPRYVNPVISVGPGWSIQANGNHARGHGNPLPSHGTFFKIEGRPDDRVVHNASVGWSNDFPFPSLGTYKEQ